MSSNLKKTIKKKSAEVVGNKISATPAISATAGNMRKAKSLEVGDKKKSSADNMRKAKSLDLGDKKKSSAGNSSSSSSKNNAWDSYKAVSRFQAPKSNQLYYKSVRSYHFLRPSKRDPKVYRRTIPAEQTNPVTNFIKLDKPAFEPVKLGTVWKKDQRYCYKCEHCSFSTDYDYIAVQHQKKHHYVANKNKPPKQPKAKASAKER